MPRLGDDTLDRVDAAPSRDGLSRDQRLTRRAAADHFATAKDNRFHGRSPFHRPLNAALTQSRVDPNHAWTRMIAGR